MRVLLLLALFAIAFAANDCSSRADGLYALSDCSSSFLTCSGGVPRIMDCPANLIFSEQLQLCDYPGSIAACAGSTESPSSTAAPGEPTCSGRADGFYELSGCNTNFLTCSGGVARVMECPAQLIFVEERQLCDYAESVPACEASSGEESGESSGGESGDVSGESGENSTTPASENSGVEASAENPEESGDASGESGLSPSDDAASGMSGDESGLWSGILPVEYDPSGASGEASGETREYSGETSGVSGEGISGEESGDEASPNSGEASGSSDAETSGAEGSGIENSGIESSGTETSGTETSGGESSGIEGSGVESSGEGLSCSGTSDGFYSLGCSSKLKACSNGEATTLECPSNLVFNEAVGACDYPGYVSACSLNRGASGNEVESSGEWSGEGSSSGEASGGISFCEGRANGFYQLGCSSSILSCANELEHMLVCPLGLMYDQSRAVCDYPLSIVACREEGSGAVSGSVWEEEDEEREATRLPVSPRPVVPID